MDREAWWGCKESDMTKHAWTHSWYMGVSISSWKSAFLSLHTINIWGQKILCCGAVLHFGGCLLVSLSMLQSMRSQRLGDWTTTVLYVPDTSSLGLKRMSPDAENTSWKVQLLPLRIAIRRKMYLECHILGIKHSIHIADHFKNQPINRTTFNWEVNLINSDSHY